MGFPVLSPISHKAGDPPILEIRTNPGAGPALRVNGQEVAAAAGGGGLVDFATKWKTDGNIDFNSTVWIDIPGAGALDLVLDAGVGDWIEVGCSFFHANATGEQYVDCVTIVDNAIVQTFSSDGDDASVAAGIGGWRAFNGTWPARGSVTMQLTNDSIDGGKVRLRLRVRSSQAGGRTIAATATTAFNWWAKNHGPAFGAS